MALVLKGLGRQYVFEEARLRAALKDYDNAKLASLKRRYTALHERAREGNKAALVVMLGMLDEEIAERARCN
jgi:hypothetical protein